MEQKDIETLLYAFDSICNVKEKIEDSGKNKRISNRLDKSLSELWIAIENISDKVKGE